MPTTLNDITHSPAVAAADSGPITVSGATNLAGTVTVARSVRAALVMLAAAAVHTGPFALTRVPRGGHVEQMLALMGHAGCQIVRGAPGEAIVTGVPATRRAEPAGLSELFDAARTLPAAVYLVPAFLRGYGCAVLPRAAAEPIEDVLEVYAAFGDAVSAEPAGYSVVATAHTRPVVEVTMRTGATAPTVAAMLRACAAGSRIVVRNPSRHAEVHALAAMLLGLGWRGHDTPDRLVLERGSAVDGVAAPYPDGA